MVSNHLQIRKQISDKERDQVVAFSKNPVEKELKT